MQAAASPGESPAAKAALEELYTAYQYPLYAFARSKTGSRAQAEEAVQGFFVFVLEKGTLTKADEARGAFRGFLQTCFGNFLRNEWRREKTEKCGASYKHLSLDFESAHARYSLEPADRHTPDQLFDRAWAVTALRRAMERLRADYARRGDEVRYQVLKRHLLAESLEDSSAKDVTQTLGISTGAAHKALSRMRSELKSYLLAEAAETLTDPAQAEDEVWQLFRALDG